MEKGGRKEKERKEDQKECADRKKVEQDTMSYLDI